VDTLHHIPSEALGFHLTWAVSRDDHPGSGPGRQVDVAGLHNDEYDISRNEMLVFS
jgi:hypothetical protein